MNKVADHWAVQVYVDGNSVLCIEHHCLYGDSDIERHEATIVHCANQLLAFIAGHQGCEAKAEIDSLRTELAKEITEKLSWMSSAAIAMKEAEDLRTFKEAAQSRLREIEWSDYLDEEYDSPGLCPDCSSTHSLGHRPDCDLATLLNPEWKAPQ